jgi:hypothetical protein
MPAATEERADETTATEDETKVEAERLDNLLFQISAEHKLSADYIRRWRNKQLRRLKLYNNQAREESKVGDRLLFIVFQTVFAALYDGRLTVQT